MRVETILLTKKKVRKELSKSDAFVNITNLRSSLIHFVQV